VLAAALAVAIGWFAHAHGWRDAGAKPLAYRDLTAEVRLQPPRPGERRFRTRQSLREYVRRTAGDGVRLPSVDFRREEALFVALGPRSSTGYELRVTRAVEERGRIVVTMREDAPTLRNPGRAQLSYPYRLLVFRRSDKPVHIDLEGRP
jgi:hypothetical protein